MVQTSKEPLTINGVGLNTFAKNIESVTGRLRAPAYRTGNIVVPGKQGELRIPSKVFQAQTIALGMWVLGCDDDGAIPSGSTARREFFKRVDELVALLKDPAGLDLRWTKADGEVRQAYAECLDVLDFTTDLSPKALVGVNLTIPDAFWQDAVVRTQSFVAANATANPTRFQGGTGPMEDLVYALGGPWISPQLTFSDGSYWAYDGTIPAGITMSMQPGDWELGMVGAPASYTSSSGSTVTVPRAAKLEEDEGKVKGLANGNLIDYRKGTFFYADGTVLSKEGWFFDYARVRHDGEDACWAALPRTAAAIALGGSGRTTDSAFAITGRRKFLVG